MRAADILRDAAATIESHRSGRDANNESSVALAARMFSQWRGISFSERDAAVFMVLLKLARAERSRNPDNWLDGAAYVAMAGAADETTPAPTANRVVVRGPDPHNVADDSLYRDLHSDPKE